MSKTNIIGIGSPFGMDRIGWDVIDYLQQQAEQLIRDCRLVKLDRPGTELITLFDKEAKNIIIDAIQSDHETGEVLCLEINDIPKANSKFSSHSIGLADTLQLADILNQLPEQMKVIGKIIGSSSDSEPDPEQVRILSERVIKEIIRYP